ncbi:hypothetical protein GGR56DRAFT_637843 [Xylariaceae sp. FL0804]|nr:hypothetical protein GGR56DRAFT_637843 [Xylariaceae sp. FL0804]
MVRISEAARQRETLRFEGSSIAATTPIDPSKPWPLVRDAAFTADPVLTSLAQLGALRLGTACGLVSFFDKKHEYILADATPASPIRTRPHVPAHHGLRGHAIPRSSSIGEHVIFQADAEDAASARRADAPLSVFLAPDVATDDRFAGHHRDLYQAGIGFYAGVAIRSPHGLNIGVYSVYDEKPRSELRPDDLAFLQDMSFTITSHLQAKQTRSDLRRSERMVRGLGSFVEGSAGMSFDPISANVDSFRDVGTEGALNAKQQTLQQKAQAELSPGSDPSPPSPEALQPPATSYFQPRAESSSSAEHTDPGAAAAATISEITTPSIRSMVTLPSEDSEDEHLTSIKALFSRAANIIRESTEVAGVLFLDASISSYGGLVTSENNLRRSDMAHSGPDDSSSSEESTTDPHGGNSEKFCNVFGFSTSSSSSIDGNSAVSYQAEVPDKFMKTLLRRYPQGRIFNFDEDGSISTCGDSSGDDGFLEAKRPSLVLPSKPWPRQHERDTLMKILPGARSVMMVPLWDSNKERWFAGGLIWTCSPSRAFTVENELSYLRAFGMTIMAEIVRLEALLYDKAKTDVLGSLSHELRSPLHGVVAAVDLLHDTGLDAFQSDVLHSMESCGRTLLDVVNHLLDYSKVNAFLRDAREEKNALKRKRQTMPQRENSFWSNNLRLSTDVRLDALVEETVDSVFAGHVFQKASVAQIKTDSDEENFDSSGLRRADTLEAMESFGHQLDPAGKLQVQLGDVAVFLDIDPDFGWNFRAQPGAIRRILMNIFANSLRFTSRGIISVSLRQETGMTKKGRAVTNVKLTVTDTGQGISHHFLQHNLFTPFSQEDRLSPGTGVGLSLVKQIIRTLGGSVTVESQLGVGTCVRVTIPAPNRADEIQGDHKFEQQRTALAGLRVAVVGLGDEPYAKVPYLASLLPKSETDLMRTICSVWLKLQIVALDDPDVRPDLIICGESSVDRLLADFRSQRLIAPVVAICKSYVDAHDYIKSFRSSSENGIFEFISQPIGPRKLAKALDAALNRWCAIAQATIPSPGDPNGPEVPARVLPSIVADLNSVFPSVVNQAQTALPTEDQAQPAESAEKKDPGQGQDGGQDTLSPPPPPTVAKQIDPQHELEAGAAPKAPGTDVLLVDDNQINRRILVSFMKKLKKPHNTAIDGLEAFKFFSADPARYACILMDLSMPVMDGFESTRRVRELERAQGLQPVPIIALTGLASADAQKEAFTSGMDRFLTKPVKLKELADVLMERGL